MKIEFHNAFGKPQSIEVTRVVVFDDHNNPLALALKFGQTIVVSTADHHPMEFHRLLRELGLYNTVIVKDAAQIPIKDLQFGR